MEFIKLEQFMSQDDKVIEELKNWWKPKRYDLYIDNNDLSLVECMDYTKADIFYSARNNMSYKEDMIPLLTEGQLRKFIEDKTGYKIDTTNIVAFDMYKIELCELDKNTGRKHIAKTYNFNEETLLQAYWKVAIQIAKES